MTAIRIVVGNNKGGAGKTFTALALAEAAARFCKAKVLVVDMDPQANATRRLGLKPDGRPTLSDCLRPGVRNGAGAAFVCSHGWGEGELLDIDVLPSDLRLEDRVFEAGTPGAERRLRNALFGVDEHYHLTIIDAPPSIGHLSNMALAACDGRRDMVVVPLRPETDDITGALRVVEHIENNRENLGVPDLTVGGLVINGIREAVSLHMNRTAMIPTLLPQVPVVARIPLRAAVAEVQDRAIPLAADHIGAAILDRFRPFADSLMRSQVPS